MYVREVTMKVLYGVNTRSYPLDTNPSGTGHQETNFDMLLKRATHAIQREEVALLGKDTLEALVRIIERQVRDHAIHLIRADSRGWAYAGAWKTGLRYTSGLSPAIPLHQAPQRQSGTAADTVERIIDRSSREHGVGADLIRAVIRAESGFDPQATSPKGAMGLMQLMPETARDLGVNDPYDPAQNVMAGTRYLKRLLDRYEGNVDVALAAYNWGPGNVERNSGSLPEETKTYIARVTRYRNQATA